MARPIDPNRIQKNQQKIIAIAKKIFAQKGMEVTTMNDIAKEAGMSKSTLYVYYKNKEAIQNDMALEGMDYLYTQLQERVDKESMNLHDRYMTICRILVELKEKHPLSFQLIVSEISVDEQSLQENAVLARIYEVGERINRYVYENFFNENQSNKDLFCNVFTQWGAIYGVIMLADNKQAYLQKSVGMSREEFLQQGFERLFQMMEQSESI